MTWTKAASLKSIKSDCYKVDCPRQWYLPHHSVFHPHKTGKVRRVLNGAATLHYSFLIYALLTESDWMKISFTSSCASTRTSKPFLSILKACFFKLVLSHKTNREFTFLWREDPSEETTFYQFLRQIFRAKILLIYAIYALRRNATDNKTTFPEATSSVKTNFYEDNYIDSSPTVEEATRKAQELEKMLAKGGVTLPYFASNVRGVL